MMSEPLFVVRCGRLFIGEGPAVRVGTPTQAKRFTEVEARKKVAALLSGNRKKFPLPWAMEPAPQDESGDQ